VLVVGVLTSGWWTARRVQHHAAASGAH